MSRPTRLLASARAHGIEDRVLVMTEGARRSCYEEENAERRTPNIE